MRTSPNEMQRWTLESMGFSVQIMPLPEVYLAIQQGRGGGQENPIDTILSNRFYEVAPNVTLTKHVYSPIPLTISEKTWQKLSEADRDAVTKAAKEAAAWSRKEIAANDEAQLADMTVKGRQDRAAGADPVPRLGQAGVRQGQGEVRRRRRRASRRRRNRAQGDSGQVALLARIRRAGDGTAVGAGPRGAGCCARKLIMVDAFGRGQRKRRGIDDDWFPTGHCGWPVTDSIALGGDLLPKAPSAPRCWRRSVRWSTGRWSPSVR